MEHVLDNVAWHSLTGRQAGFGVANELAARYAADISPIGAVREPTLAALEALANLAAGEPVAVITDAAQLPDVGRFRRIRTAALRQMVCETRCAPVEIAATPLGDADVDDMVALVKLTEPGPFANRSIEFGGYFGIRDGGRLLAMAGERLKVPGWTEVSGVCTHPDGRGRGYAYGLVVAVTNAILTRGDAAFLHVAIGSPSEASATRVYERVGFRQRRETYLHVLVPR
jgi:predicted GNAT family acetyltransferase